MATEIIRLDSSIVAKDYNLSSFGNFLSQRSDVCDIDLSNATLIEVLQAMIQLKSLMSPNYGKKYSSLFYESLCCIE